MRVFLCCTSKKRRCIYSYGSQLPQNAGTKRLAHLPRLYPACALLTDLSYQVSVYLQFFNEQTKKTKILVPVSPPNPKVSEREQCG